MKKSVRLTAAMVAMLSLSTGCSSVATDGPLIAGGDAGDLCVPAPQEGFAAIGEVVTNGGNEDLIISDIELVDSTDLNHEESYIMLIDELKDASSGVVLGTTSTETTDPLQMAAWERRIKLEDFTLGPGESANVIVTVSLPTSGTDGTAEAMRIAYADSSSEFTADSSTTITLTGEETCV